MTMQSIYSIYDFVLMQLFIHVTIDYVFKLILFLLPCITEKDCTQTGLFFPKNAIKFLNITA